MALVDPKNYQPKEKDEPAVTQSDFLLAFQALLAQMKTAAPADAERAAIEAERLLLEQERLKREMPENKQSPGISVYSYPEGDLARPKPDLKCKMHWIGYELRPETLTPGEVDLLNKLTAGDYRVTKTDGTQIPFRVSAKHNDRFQLEELSIWFPCKGEHKHNHNSMTSYLQQALGEKVPSTEELLAELTRMRAELEAQKAGVVGRVN